MKGFKDTTKTVMGHNFTHTSTPVRAHVRATPIRSAMKSPPKGSFSEPMGTRPMKTPTVSAPPTPTMPMDTDSLAMKRGGKLDAADRKAMPKSTFGLPGSRKYPMPDRSHAANAKARASQMVAAGKLSPSSKAKIDAKANRILGKAKGGKIEKVMHEFKTGALHSGSKKGPPVKDRKQAIAIALSEAKKSPMKKADGGKTGYMSTTETPADAIESNRAKLAGMDGKYAKGGLAMAEDAKEMKADVKQDKAMIRAAVHKHERHDHPGKPLTKLRRGGMPTFRSEPMVKGRC